MTKMMVRKLAGGALVLGIALTALVGRPGTADAACYPPRPACISPGPQPVLLVNGPDLVPTYVFAQRASPTSGYVGFVVKLKNRGDVTVRAGSGTGISITGFPFDTQSWWEGEIAPGQEVTHAFLVWAPGATRVSGFMLVDAADAVRESNESNNRATFSFYV